MRAITRDADAAPEHHDDLLILRVGPHLMRDARRPHDTPALRHLARLEARGHLHGVHAMDGGSLGGSLGGSHARVVRALRRAHRHHRTGEAHRGIVMVHLKHARHREALHDLLRDDPHVEWAERVPMRFIAGSEIRLPAPRGWHHAAVRLEEARALPGFREPRRIRVGVIDTGVDAGHPALRGRIARYVHRIGPYHAGPEDVVGHGTHVCGIIAAGANDMGAAGMCRPRLFAWKVFSTDTYLAGGPDAAQRHYLVDAIAYRAALHDALAARLDVLNLSLGGTGRPDPHEAALLARLQASGTTIVAAMGNSIAQRRRPSYPAASPGVVAVGAVDRDGEVAGFSGIGRHIALCAPGVEIWSTLPRQPGTFGYGVTPSGRRAAGPSGLERNVRYDGWLGTSMACPQVTAAVAMLVGMHGPMTPDDVRLRLMRTATPLPAMRGRAFTMSCGAGRLDVARLLADATRGPRARTRRTGR